MLIRSPMNSQSVLLKSGLNPMELSSMTFVLIQSPPKWPSALGYMVLNQVCLYSGSHPNEESIFTLIETENSQIILKNLREFFPTLSYIDLAMIHQHFQKNQTQSIFSHLAWSDFFQSYNAKLNLDLIDLFKILLQLPFSARTHIHEKKWQWGDLQLFLSLKEISEPAKSVFEKLFSLNFSKSDMVHCCELVIECLLLSREIPETVWKSSDVKKSLYRIRHPQQNEKHAPSALIKNVQIRPIRQNDRQGFEFKFFSATPAEFQRTIQKIQDSEMDWK
ncbi:MAG: hypothetical protein ACK5WZ_06820 [Pseudobdellovibrionaceae bacterium]|jgi:hypothetical protein